MKLRESVRLYDWVCRSEGEESSVLLGFLVWVTWRMVVTLTEMGNTG